ncbi:uncharacterized protein Bfra_011181 [Botrytis fragariae]|uniref:Uncharacterized protein n=1 Tax=Botrytis fragariae TaxID=1964551 RepID=A0A8H6ALB7_9HELO|nr:uncharacterized protein Bfra_011181 [Botrytis fragariae]KAF5869375.1 hypothetical protein Bfra_011181 [Botrytis fragariae]
MPVKIMELYDVGPAGIRTHLPLEIQRTPPVKTRKKQLGHFQNKRNCQMTAQTARMTHCRFFSCWWRKTLREAPNTWVYFIHKERRATKD